MQGKWRWFSYALGLAFLASIGLQALSVPWTWTFQQILLAFYLGFTGLIAGWWTFIWFRGGSEAVKEKWRSRDRWISGNRVQVKTQSPKFLVANLLF